MPDDKEAAILFYEDALRKAEAALEEAGVAICSETGEAAAEARFCIHTLLEGIQDAIHNVYKLEG